MTNFTLKRVDVFPAGTTVGAYPQSNWPTWALPPSGAPQGSAAATALSDGVAIAFTGLTSGVEYFAAAQVGGVWRYIGFRVAGAPETRAPLYGGFTAGQIPVWDSPSGSFKGASRPAPAIELVYAVGNSLPAGFGASDTSRDVMTRLARSLKALEFNYAKNAAVMFWHNDRANDRWGVTATIKQIHRRPKRASSTLTAIPAAGATTLTMGSTTGFKVGDIVHVGSGATDGTGGEIMVVAGIASATQLTVGQNESLGTGTIRAHAIGDPVFVVPSEYDAANTLYLLNEVHNALSTRMPDATLQGWYQPALREAITRMRASEIYELDHAAHVFGGTWGASTGAEHTSSGSGTGGIKQPQASGATWTLHLPNNFRGGAVGMHFIGQLTAPATVSFTVDGVAAGTLTLPIGPTTPGNTFLPTLKRLTGLTAGRHVIVATVTSLGTGSFWADYASIEAELPPLIVVSKGHRPYSWDLYGSAKPYGHIRPTLAIAPAAGATTVTVTQSPNAASRQIGVAIPAVGETITLDPRGPKKQILTVNGAPVANGGNWDIPVTPAVALATHLVGETVHIGVQDADLATINAWIDSVIAEFDSSVVAHNAEGVLTDPSTGLPDKRMFYNADGLHFSDAGAAAAADDILTLIAGASGQRQIVQSSQTPVPLGQRVTFLDDSVAFGWAVPLALTEFGGAVNWRRQADFTRARECRLGIVQPALATAGARLRVQYSLDGGTTWFFLTRKVRLATDETSTDWVEPTAAGDITPVEIDCGAVTGLKVSSWGFIYPEALTDVQLRLVGIGGGAGASTFMSAWLEVR